MTLLTIKHLPLDFLWDGLYFYNLMLVRFSIFCSCMHPDTSILHKQDVIGNMEISQVQYSPQCPVTYNWFICAFIVLFTQESVWEELP